MANQISLIRQEASKDGAVTEDSFNLQKAGQHRFFQTYNRLQSTNIWTDQERKEIERMRSQHVAVIKVNRIQENQIDATLQ